MTRATGLRWCLHREAGFTLVEMLAALTILLTVLGSLTVLMVSATTSEADLTQRVDAQQEARQALEGMRRDVHCARAASGVTPNVPSPTVTLTIPSTCPSSGGSTSITWCTRGSGSRWELRRLTTPPPVGTCPAAGRREADYLTQPDVFSLTSSTDTLSKLCVEFTVDRDPTTTRASYRLRDGLVLRNSTRATSTPIGTHLC